MKNILNEFFYIFGHNELDKLGGVSRSPKWPQFKKDFESINPKKCAVCGNPKVQLHHIIPFHASPEKELQFTNCLWLCEGLLTDNHHLWFGHLGNFQSINVDVVTWIDNTKHRPLFDGKTWQYK